MAQIFNIDKRLPGDIAVKGQLSVMVERIKSTIASYPYGVQVNIRNEMISALIETNYCSESKRQLFETIEYIRNLWS